MFASVYICTSHTHKKPPSLPSEMINRIKTGHCQEAPTSLLVVLTLFLRVESEFVLSTLNAYTAPPRV